MKEPSAGNTGFRGKQFGNPPISFYEMCPIDFFKLFWTYNITQTLVVQTNLYSVQEQGKNISTLAKEIEQFLGMHILMGIMKLQITIFTGQLRPAILKLLMLCLLNDLSNCKNMSMLLTINKNEINQEIKMINFSKYVLLQKQLEKIAWP